MPSVAPHTPDVVKETGVCEVRQMPAANTRMRQRPASPQPKASKPAAATCAGASARCWSSGAR